MIKMIIFDLDGTLLNTIDDLGTSANYALAQCSFPIHDIISYKMFVGDGVNKLFERALPEGEKTEENIGRIRQHFLLHYAQHNTRLTTPYPGIVSLLEKLSQRNIVLAIASNKYQAATEKLILHYFPSLFFTSVLGQRDGIVPKPDPTIIHDTLRNTPFSVSEVLYVGDSGVDMQTATNSHITPVGVSWGFRSKEELVSNGAKFIIDSPLQLLEIIDQIES